MGKASEMKNEAKMATDDLPYYACAARVGQETQVAEELAEIAPWVWVAKRLEPIRVGKSRKRDWSERPMWPGYVFAQLGAEHFFEARNIKGLHPTKLQLHPTEKRILLRAAARLDDELHSEKRRIERQRAPAVTYEPGQTVDILDGAFVDRLAAFQRVIRRAGREYGRINIHGWPVPVDIPLEDLKAAE